MKKLNKKGFTLAELLIVIAIIAILIAIAIPTFAGALENAKRQTDHANMRNAYAIMQVANLQGGKFTNDTTGALEEKASPLYFYKDGTVGSYDADKVYTLQAKHDYNHDTISDCGSSQVCLANGKLSPAADPAVGNVIILTKDSNNVWSIKAGTYTTSP